MNFRALLAVTLLVAVNLGGCSRLFDSTSYEKAVPASPADVRAALGSIPLGSDSGGGPPILRSDQPDGFTWTLTRDGKVLFAMKAVIVPLENGRRARVEGSVSKGDARVDDLPPGFSTPPVADAFSKLLDAALNPLAAPNDRVADEVAATRRSDALATLDTLQRAANAPLITTS